MTDPIGQDTYKGMAVPLYGESLIHQRNSSNAILTLMHSSANTGRLMMGLDYKDIDSEERSSLLTDLAVFDIDTDGGLRGVSGTTVAWEINPAGLYGGSTQIVDAGGKLQTERLQQVTTVAAATTGIDVSSLESGMLYWFSTQATTYQVRCGGSPFTGQYFDVFCESSDPAHLSIVCTAATHGFLFQANLATSGTFATTKAVSFGTSGVNYARFTCVSSATGQWSVSALQLADETTNTYGGLTTASATT